MLSWQEGGKLRTGQSRGRNAKRKESSSGRALALPQEVELHCTANCALGSSLLHCFLLRDVRSEQGISFLHEYKTHTIKGGWGELWVKVGEEIKEGDEYNVVTLGVAR